MIAIVFALPEESREFRRAARALRVPGAKGNQWHGAIGARAVVIAHCGVGPAAAARSIAELLHGEPPEFVIATGFAGALAPHLAIGDLVLAENVSDTALLSVAQTCGVPATTGALSSTDLPVETVAAKHALFAAGAIAVDMETATLAAACRTAAIPLLALRVISDRADEPLPVPFAHWFDLAHQRPRILPLLTYLLTHPTRIVPFTRFVRGLPPARQALATFLVAYVRSSLDGSIPSLFVPKPPVRRLWPWISVVVLLLVLGTLAAAWQIREFRSKAAWEGFRQESVARGEKLEWKHFEQPPIPNEENFAAIPLFAERVAEARAGRTVSSRLAIPHVNLPRGDLLTTGPSEYFRECRSRLTDAALLATSSYTDHPARDILNALERFRPELNQLREARSRPRERFETLWKVDGTAEFPHLIVSMGAAKILGIRIPCELELGEADNSYEDLSDGLRLYRALRPGPSMLCSMVRLSIVAELQSAIQQGLRRGQWGENRLRTILAEISKLDALADYSAGLGSEHGYITENVRRELALSPWQRMKQARKVEDEVSAFFPVSRLSALTEAILLLGKAWSYDIARKDHEILTRAQGRIDLAGQRFIPGDSEPLLDLPEGQQAYWGASVRLAGIAQTMGDRAAFLQTQLIHTRIVIALDLWRMQRGSYPKVLEELAPTYFATLPHDVISGGPLHYRLREDGGFLLYSVGLNSKDDDAQSELDPAIFGPRSQRDWVWGVPAK